MATIGVGAVIAVALFFACRHIYHNIREGKEDCYCGSDGCSGCAGCAFKKTA